MNWNFKIWGLLLLIFTTSLSSSCQTTTSNYFNEKDFEQIYKGEWKGYYCITYQNTKDNNYLFRKLYGSEKYNDSNYFKYFFYKDAMNGPMECYFLGKLSTKGFMKNNKEHGEFFSYSTEGTLLEKGTYKVGDRIGIWEEFRHSGILKHRVYYDDAGKYLKKEFFDMKGNLFRTETQESAAY